MTAITRVVHKVRVTSQASGAWAQVVVVDKMAIRGPNGDEQLYDVSAVNAVPYILDATGDLGTHGDPAKCSRTSYLQRLTSSSDPSQMFDAEVLTAFAALGPNGVELGLALAPGSAGASIADATGNGLGANPGLEATSRVLHVAGIYEQNDGTSTNTDSGGSTDGGTGRVLLTEKTDAMACRGPNGGEFAIIAPASGAEVMDTTVYNADGNPPENGDPNFYVVWPADSSGPWLGSGVPGAPGPLWWIEKAAGSGYLVLFNVSGNSAGDSAVSVTFKGLPSGALLVNRQTNVLTASTTTTWCVWVPTQNFQIGPGYYTNPGLPTEHFETTQGWEFINYSGNSNDGTFSAVFGPPSNVSIGYASLADAVYGGRTPWAPIYNSLGEGQDPYLLFSKPEAASGPPLDEVSAPALAALMSATVVSSIISSVDRYGNITDTDLKVSFSSGSLPPSAYFPYYFQGVFLLALQPSAKPFSMNFVQFDEGFEINAWVFSSSQIKSAPGALSTYYPIAWSTANIPGDTNPDDAYLWFLSMNILGTPLTGPRPGTITWVLNSNKHLTHATGQPSGTINSIIELYSTDTPYGVLRYRAAVNGTIFSGGSPWEQVQVPPGLIGVPPLIASDNPA